MTPGDAAAVAVLIHALLTDDTIEPQELSYAVEHLVTHASVHEQGMLPVAEALARLDDLISGDDYTAWVSGEWHPRFRPIEDVQLPDAGPHPVGTVLLTPVSPT